MKCSAAALHIGDWHSSTEDSAKTRSSSCCHKLVRGYHELLMWLSCTAHVAYHAMIMQLPCTGHMTDQALITQLIMHCSPGLSCIDHVTDHVLIMFGVTH